MDGGSRVLPALWWRWDQMEGAVVRYHLPKQLLGGQQERYQAPPHPSSAPTVPPRPGQGLWSELELRRLRRWWGVSLGLFPAQHRPPRPTRQDGSYTDTSPAPGAPSPGGGSPAAQPSRLGPWQLPKGCVSSHTQSGHSSCLASAVATWLLQQIGDDPRSWLHLSERPLPASHLLHLPEPAVTQC